MYVYKTGSNLKVYKTGYNLKVHKTGYNLKVLVCDNKIVNGFIPHDFKQFFQYVFLSNIFITLYST